MRDPQRIDKILAMFKALWASYPDMRFCQLVSNITAYISDNPDIFYLEDDKFEDKLKEILQNGWE